MRKLLFATAAALGLAVSAGGANATLTYTVWTGSGLDLNAVFPVPTTGFVTTFTDDNNILAFRNNNAQGGPVTFDDFCGPGSAHGLQSACSHFTPAQLAQTMSTPGNGTTTFIEITETYDLITSPGLVLLTHDDGAAIYLDGAGNGAQLCGNPAEASENFQSCAFPLGIHTLTLLYTEDNGSPAILEIGLPPELAAVPEPASLSLLGSALAGLGLFMRRRRKYA